MKGWVIDMAVGMTGSEKLNVRDLNKIFINSSGQEIQALKDISPVSYTHLGIDA